MLRQFLNPPNWFTAASIFCSVYAMAIVFASQEPNAALYARACMFVVFAGVFDLLDGRVARLTNRLSEFGVQMDSLADLISFGIAPAMIAWSWKLHTLGRVGIAIIFWYVLCAVFRLARFNTNTEERVWQLSGHSQGLTSTMGGGALVTLIWVSNGYLQGTLNIPSWAAGVFVAYLGLLMVSSVPFRTFRDVRKNRMARHMLAVVLACCLTGAVILDPSMLFGIGAFLYLTWGFLDGIAVAIRHLRSGIPLSIEPEIDFSDYSIDEI